MPTRLVVAERGGETNDGAVADSDGVNMLERGSVHYAKSWKLLECCKIEIMRD